MIALFEYEIVQVDQFPWLQTPDQASFTSLPSIWCAFDVLGWYINVHLDLQFSFGAI